MTQRGPDSYSLKQGQRPPQLVLMADQIWKLLAKSISCSNIGNAITQIRNFCLKMPTSNCCPYLVLHIHVCVFIFNIC